MAATIDAALDILHRTTLPAQPLLTTWPCLTEAMYLLWRAGGIPAQDELWGYLADGLVVLHRPEATEWERMRTLMQQYQDAPMGWTSPMPHSSWRPSGCSSAVSSP